MKLAIVTLFAAGRSKKNSPLTVSVATSASRGAQVQYSRSRDYRADLHSLDYTKAFWKHLQTKRYTQTYAPLIKFLVSVRVLKI